MFKNPLKYQQGGKTQDAIGQLVKWLVQNTGLDENQISQRLNQILSDDTAKQELVNNLQNMQKGDQNAAQNIIGMFVPQSAKFGGKIRDFICKHAKGGALKGCGCKQEGGSIWGNPYTDSLGSWRNFHFPEGGFAGTVDMNTGRAYKAETNEEMLQPGRYNRKGYPMSENASTNGTWYEVNPYGSVLVNIPEGGQQVLHGNDSTAVANLIKQWDQSKVGHATTEKENGGKVEKAQNGEKTNDTPYNGTISQGKPRSKVSQAIDNNSKARNFVKGTKQFVKSPMVKWPLAGALAYGGYRLGLTPTVQSMGDELAPHMAPYLFPFLSQMRPKFILDTMNPMKEPPKVEKPGDVFWAVPSNEKGGNIEKAQDGSIIDYYKDKWSNDLNRIKQGWSRFKESAPGKIWGTFMPNPNSETGMIGASIPGTTFVTRIPKQKPTITIFENLGNGKFSAIDDFGRSIIYDAERDKNLFQVIDKNDVILKPGKDWDIDKLYGQSLPMIEPIQYDLSKLGRITMSWPELIGKTALKWAPGIVGSAAAGSYVATKKDKNKKSENK